MSEDNIENLPSIEDYKDNSDDDLIPLGDDFGFDGTTTGFTD